MMARRWIATLVMTAGLAGCAEHTDAPPGDAPPPAPGAAPGLQHEAAIDADDSEYMLRTAQVALEFNRLYDAAEWQNRATGSSGAVIPLRTYRDGTGRYCREYRARATVGGEEKTQLGTACRDDDGIWRAP